MFLLEPKSVALIGASAEEKKLGQYVLRNLRESYTGKIYPVNPKHAELMGLRCFSSVADVPGSIDLAVVVTPAATVCGIAEECGKKKVKTLVVISAGFGELGTDEGKKREEELVAIGQQYEMSIVGPNCLGILRPSIGLNASFANTPSSGGSIGLISQSGAMAVAILDRSEQLHLGFSSIISIGNKADLCESDMLEALENDPKTAVIGLYLESIADGRRFAEVARRMGRKKPIVFIKSGVSLHGAHAVSSHTGALAGSSAGIDALCAYAGIHRAETTEEFLSLLATLSTEPSLVSSNIAVITNAGGPGVLATDAAEKAGLILPTLSKKTVSLLKKSLPPSASTANPVDVLGDALDDRYREALEACAEDPEVDGLAILLTPQVMTPCTEIAQAVIDLKKTHPLLPLTTAFMGGGAVAEARLMLRKNGIPSFETPEHAVTALAALRPRTLSPESTDDPKGDDRALGAKEILKQNRIRNGRAHEGALSFVNTNQNESGRSRPRPEALDEESVSSLFSLYELPEPKQYLAKSADEAADIAATIGLPVIAKVSSPEILHKTDVGGVRANLKTEADVRRAYAEILKNVEKNAPAAGVRGIVIQQFLPIGSEFIVGAVRDSSFGPLVMVGLGGIYTELFRDTCFRLAPVSEEEAYEMLSSLKSWKLLLGMRGKKQLSIDGLARTIVKVSQLIADCDKIAEIDLNPMLVSDTEILVADGKVIVRP